MPLSVKGGFIWITDMNPLAPLREKIDQVDKQLIDLLAQRLALVAEVGKVKSEHGIPVYAPEREAAMIAARREEAEKRYSSRFN